MGWVQITNTVTGKSVLLGEPELMKSCPPEELGERILSEWKKNHPNYNMAKDEKGVGWK